MEIVDFAKVLYQANKLSVKVERGNRTHISFIPWEKLEFIRRYQYYCEAAFILGMFDISKKEVIDPNSILMYLPEVTDDIISALGGICPEDEKKMSTL